jgi:hypothetical protein
LNALQRSIQILAERIDDEQIRSGIDALVAQVIDSLVAKKADRAWQTGGQASKEFGTLNSRIGERLRSLAAQGRASGSLERVLNNNRHRQRWTPADADGRWSPGQAGRSPDSPRRALASGRRGRMCNACFPSGQVSCTRQI